MIRAYVINLDRDTVRAAAFTARFAGAGLDIVRMPGVLGSALPVCAREALSFSAGWATRSPGEIGCFLSHVATWERVAAEPSPCFVFEDDAAPSGTARWGQVTLPDEADLVFVNDRMCGTAPPDHALECRPIMQTVARVNGGGNVGADGYLLTPQGAAKLLGAVAIDGVFGNVDWRILRYSVVPADLAGALAGSFAATVIATHHNLARPPAWGVVQAYALNVALVRVTGEDGSSIEAVNGARRFQHTAETVRVQLSRAQGC